MTRLIRRSEPRAELFGLGGASPFHMVHELLRWDPFRELGSLPRVEAFSPAFDVKENKENYILNADLPGVKENDLQVTLTGNRLAVSGKRETEARKEDEAY